MTMQGTPGAVVPYSSNTIKPHQKRTGLIRMGVGTQHAVPLEGGTQHVIARDWHDHEDAKCVYLCLHPRCSGRTWPSYEEMRKAHPNREQMAKAQEAHVYGMWSTDTLNPEALAEAKAKHTKAVKELADVKKMPEALTTLAGREMVKEYTAAVEAAEAALSAAQVNICLIAPPELAFEG